MTRTRWVLLALCALAFWLRTQAIGYGLPAVYNMDEVAIMNRALTFGTGTLNPGNFLYPTFYFYVLFAWQGLTWLVGMAMGLWGSLAEFEQQFFIDPSSLYRSGRLLSALCGTLTVAAVYSLTARIYDRAAGLMAAALMAVMPIAVMDAHYVKHDVPVTLLIVLVHVWLARIITTEGRAVSRDVWITGAIAGLAMSTHYYAVFVALPVAVVLLRQPRVPASVRLQDGARAGAAATIAFLAGSPFLLPELGTAWVDITQNRQIVLDRALEHSGWFPSLSAYSRMLRDSGMSSALPIAALLGFLVVSDTGRRVAWLTVFPLAFLLFISNTVPATRYLNPLLPFVVIGLAFVVRRLTTPDERKSRRRVLVLRVLAPLVLLGVFLPGLVASLKIGTLFNQDDTRTLAQEWIHENVPEGATILIQPYSVPLRQSREGLVEALRVTQGDETRASVRFRKQLALSPYPAPAYRTIFLGDGGLDADKIYISPAAFTEGLGLAPLDAMGVQWVVVKRYNVANPSLAALDRVLAREGRLIATFSPYDPAAGADARTTVAPFEHNEDARLDPALLRPGPVVEIWRID